MNVYRFKGGPIEELSWGKFVIRGKVHSKSFDGRIVGAGKDIRLIGDEVTPWSERKGHRLSIDMVTGVFNKGLEVLIIGTGFYGALEVPPEVIDYIKSKGIPQVILLPTPKACETYNKLYSKGVRVGMLAHGTC